MKVKIILMTLVLSMALAAMHAVPFMDGETLVFGVKYGLVTAAEASLSASSSTYQGVPVWYLKTDAKTHSFFDPVFKVRDRVESWWRKDTLLPMKYSKRLQEGSYNQYRIHTFRHNELKTTYQKYSTKQGTFKSEELRIPGLTQDILSAFYWVRTQPLIVGKTIYVNITSDGRSVDTKVLVHRRETINTIFGKISCLVIEPKLKQEGLFKQSGRILIWVTDDQYKIPVKLDSAITFGSFVATLKTAENVPYKVK